MKRKIELLKNFIILLAGNIIPKFVALVTLPIITGQLTKTDYGYYDLIITMVTLLLPVMTLQLHLAAFRFLMNLDEKDEKSGVIVSNIVFSIIPLSAITCIVLFFVTGKYSVEIRILAAIYFFSEILFRLLLQIVRGFHKNKIHSSAIAINSAFILVLTVLTVYFWNMGLYGALISITVSNYLAFIFLSVRIKFFSMLHISYFSKENIKELLIYSIPLIPNALSYWVLSASDRFVLTAFWGAEVEAIYSVSTKIPNLLNMFQRSFSQAWQENASIVEQDDKAEKAAYYSEMFDNMFTIISGFLAALIFTTPIFFRLLTRGDYQKSYVHIPILLMGAFFLSIASYMEGIYIALKQTKSVGVTTVVCALFNLGLDLLLVKSIGIYAASISTLVAYFAIAIYRMLDIKRFQAINYKWTKIAGFILVLSLMSFICAQNTLFMDITNALLGTVFIWFSCRKYIRNILNKLFKKMKPDNEGL